MLSFLQCGNNKTVCPNAPERPDSDLVLYRERWYERLRDRLKQLADYFRLHGSKFLIMFWVILVLICLGVIKVVHILITQEVKMDAILTPWVEASRIAKEWKDYILKELCPTICDNFWTTCGNGCRICCRKCCWAATCGKLVRREERIINRQRIERGWRAPPYCNGMCRGAKHRRQLHRRLMRVMKRTGARKDTPWYSKPYNCTCKIKDQMPCIVICKGLFFFFYCPLLPLYWALLFTCIYLKRKWRRWKRIKVFRAEKAEKEEEKKLQYLHMDKYSRGILESEIVNLDKELKEIRRLEKEYGEFVRKVCMHAIPTIVTLVFHLQRQI